MYIMEYVALQVLLTISECAYQGKTQKYILTIKI